MVNRDEIAGIAEKKLPPSRRNSGFDPASLRLADLPQLYSVGNRPDVDLGVRTTTIDAFTAPLHAAEVRSIKVLEMIGTEVRIFRQSHADSLSVVIRPDSSTEMSLRVVMRDGRVEAHARCERGDFSSLSSHWPELQQTLAQRGVRLAPLSESSIDLSGGFSTPQQSGKREAVDSMPAERRSKTPKPSTRAKATTHSRRSLLESWA